MASLKNGSTMDTATEAESTGGRRCAWLRPAQQATLDEIRVPQDQRPVYPDGFAEQRKHELESSLRKVAGAARDLDDRGLWISKRDLAGVFGCEAQYLAERDMSFEWTVATARGTVLHKAAELSTHSDLNPTGAVDAAVASLVASEKKLGDFLTDLSVGEKAELRADCASMLSRFSETFPPMPPSWNPATELRARVRLCEGAFVLSGKYDLTLGTSEPVGEAGEGMRAGKVIVDLKTGRRSLTDREDLRFYALIETLLVGVPPLGIGSFYVADGRIEHEPVTDDVLDSAARRTVDGIRRIVELASGGREPTREPGPRCRWCPISEDCEPGQEWLIDSDD